jgi:hypothetical protein
MEKRLIKLSEKRSEPITVRLVRSSMSHRQAPSHRWIVKVACPDSSYAVLSEDEKVIISAFWKLTLPP